MCGDSSQEMGVHGGVADHCGWRWQDHSLDLTHHKALPPSEPPKLGLTGSSWVARQAWARCPDCLDRILVCPDSGGGYIPAALPNRAGLPPALVPAPPTHCYLGREDRFSFYWVSFSSSNPLLAALAGRSFPDSNLGQNSVFSRGPTG